MEIMFRTTTFARAFAVVGAAGDARSAASAGLGCKHHRCRMIALQRLSAVPRLSSALPLAVWCRPATISLVQSHGDNGLSGAIGPMAYVRTRTEFFRPSEDVARMNALSRDTLLAWRSIQTRSRAIARSRRAVMRDRSAATVLHIWCYRVGTKVCLAAASGVLAGARLLLWLGLIGPGGLRAAFACSGRLTQAGMCFWRRGRR
jgi:hypothetical protein